MAVKAKNQKTNPAPETEVDALMEEVFMSTEEETPIEAAAPVVEESDAGFVPQILASTTAPYTERLVKVRLKRGHRCRVGGKWYTFQGGAVETVPETVKEILAQSGLLLPL